MRAILLDLAPYKLRLDIARMEIGHRWFTTWQEGLLFAYRRVTLAYLFPEENAEMLLRVAYSLARKLFVAVSSIFT